ncbi:ATP-dependent sacrificial sulfur transferase LarE [Methanobrevibacter sp.]|uniref:ATP-dependent sacrificial sulfur transferase LarE n=1 Tax=Methanobrevibacter sp. TaxID=66852 RepID=UPI00386475F2
MDLEDKIEIVENILKDKKVAIGFSGGADSTLMAYLSSRVAADTLAITIDNNIMPTDFIENTRNAAKSFGIRHEIVDIDFYEDEDFLKNTSKRCFTCRELMYSTIERVARENGFDFICDGNNISDLVQDRPGILITYKKGFKTPFIEAKLTSKDIHEYLDMNDIKYSRSTTCLATRIPTNTQVTRDEIARIGNAEDYILDSTNCEITKVRSLDGIGIIEVDDIDEIIKDDKFKQINDELKGQGFRKVALNLAEIDDNEYIKLDYNDKSFSYQLPFEVNIENTLKEIGSDAISKSGEIIELENIEIFESGLVKGHDLENYETALNIFMETLTKIRREI